jgi:hypothetical protein
MKRCDQMRAGSSGLDWSLGRFFNNIGRTETSANDAVRPSSDIGTLSEIFLEAAARDRVVLDAQTSPSPVPSHPFGTTQSKPAGCNACKIKYVIPERHSVAKGFPQA